MAGVHRSVGGLNDQRPETAAHIITRKQGERNDNNKPFALSHSFVCHLRHLQSKYNLSLIWSVLLRARHTAGWYDGIEG